MTDPANPSLQTDPSSRAAVLVTAEGLAEELAGEHPPVVLDVRWSLGGPPGHGLYLEGHVPGAVYVDLDTELAAHPGPEHPVDPTQGRHPLPPVDRLQDAVRRWGIDDGDAVVVYDGNGNLAAARAWWLLRWAGVADVRLLDGALPAWVAAQGALETDDVRPRPGSATVKPGQLPTLDADGAAGWPREGVLLDARAAERYRGETEPVDPKAGHIPGALNAPTPLSLAPDGRFLPTEDLVERFAALGIEAGTPVAAYCGSGVTAAHEVAALAVAGFDAALYPGSWSQWSNLDRPVQTGADA